MSYHRLATAAVTVSVMLGGPAAGAASVVSHTEGKLGNRAPHFETARLDLTSKRVNSRRIDTTAIARFTTRRATGVRVLVDGCRQTIIDSALKPIYRFSARAGYERSFELDKGPNRIRFAARAYHYGYEDGEIRRRPVDCAFVQVRSTRNDMPVFRGVFLAP